MFVSRCRSGNYIPNEYLCDGEFDCQKEEDEAYCERIDRAEKYV